MDQIIKRYFAFRKAGFVPADAWNSACIISELEVIA